jgi:hypothetical protein
MTEQWTQWNPIPGLAKKYYIESVSGSIEGFKIVLHKEGNKKEKSLVFFENSVDAYRSTDESFRLKIVYELAKKYGDDFYAEWTFFKVNNSSYTQWILEQASGTADDTNFIHFAFIDPDSILDVICQEDPKIQLLECP